MFPKIKKNNELTMGKSKLPQGYHNHNMKYNRKIDQSRLERDGQIRGIMPG